MSILVLNNLAYESCQIDQLYECSQIVFLTSDHIASTFDSKQYLHFESFPNYVTNDQVMLRAVELHQIYHFTYVIALHEFDLIRAARLREYLHIEGQVVSSALEFRNKWIMKQKLQKNGISVAPMALVRTGLELVHFIQEQGYPVVVKPVDGAGSIQTYVLHNQEELEDYLAQKIPHQLLAEKYVTGDYFHVDGWVENGEVKLITASQYQAAPLVSSNMTNVISLMLHPQNPLAKRLTAGTKRVLEILETPKNTTFHAEWFQTPDDQLVFGEIASRTGGGKISEMHKIVYDISLFDVFAKIQGGLSIVFSPSQEQLEYPDRLAGLLIVNTQNGTLRTQPHSYPDWVRVSHITGKDGEQYQDAILSVDSIAQYAFEGENEIQLQQRLYELLELVQVAFRWENGITTASCK
jgi:biotin carboxylase